MTLSLRLPDDWHVHLRDGPGLASVAAHSAGSFGRALVMPNLVPPVRTLADALAYRDRILAALPAASGFRPMMTLYLADATPPEVLAEAAAHPDVLAVKLYPAGATTNAESGVTDPDRLDVAYQEMARAGLVLAVHGEVTDPDVDVFDREAVFLERVLAPILERHPDLRVVVEHATTEQAVRFVRSAGPNVAATLTAHHLLLNRNALFAGGLRPHHYCLPVLKRERHRQALLEAATSGEPCFFLGTDSAPHARGRKESDCGCAGCYTAPHALALYAEAFESVGALDRLEGFASLHGAAFYGLAPNEERVALVPTDVEIPSSYPFGDDIVVPLRAGGRARFVMQRASAPA